MGYGILPEYYLRNYLIRDPATNLLERENCSFGTERAWLGFEHRLSRRNTIEYRVTWRNEIYQAPFSAYDMNMLEASTAIDLGTFKSVPVKIEVQYGVSDNSNAIDTKDRSYHYLNLRPVMSFRLPGKHRLEFSGRYDQRAYTSEDDDDPLHAGRYQDELYLESTLVPRLSDHLVVEVFAGYRERRIDAENAQTVALKSFERYWVGLRFGFASVIDMYF